MATGKAVADGTVRREFETVTVVCNPMGSKAVSVTFREDRGSAATGKIGRTHELESPDGDLFLKVK
ncbi:MAG: hypothetical protein GXY58_16200 [Planctomycetaceae bacterium]|nr:hypothetical protein [Planctomycetaceae bacterium]